jgi:hypothetical protein
MHVPQSSNPPQPSPAGPHCAPWLAQSRGVHVGTSGATHDPRSKIVYSRSFSSALIGETHFPPVQTPWQHCVFVVQVALSSRQPPIGPLHIWYVRLAGLRSQLSLQHSLFVKQ